MTEWSAATPGGDHGSQPAANPTRVRRRWPRLSPPPNATSAGWALLPLRVFLGATFVFAGLQKLANPGFFTASDPASIQAQLAGAARRSPIHALVAHLQGAAVPLGVVIALAELAIGLGTLLGLWSRIAAAGGVVLSFTLFLTVSFHSSPYYTGADIVFVFAWLPFLVAGSGGVLSVDAVIDGSLRTRHGEATAAGDRVDRRRFALKTLAGATVGAVGLLAAGLAAGIGRLGGTTSTPSTRRLLQPPAGPASTASPSARPGTTAPAAATPPGKKIGPASDVPVGGAAQFTDPATGDPALVVQEGPGTFAAFDAVCPHAGCTVSYEPAVRLFVCPCHGSQFNGETGAVEVGPAPRGLRRITIAEGPDGELYAV